MLQIETEEVRDSKWLNESKKLVNTSNLICITKDDFKTAGYNPLIWFGTNIAAFLAEEGDTEICPLYGKHINSIDDFGYQLCRAIPWGFEMGRNLDAIYDVVLNFTSEPKNRYFIWHDAQHMFRANRELFEGVFECLIVASYLNSTGKATDDYKVNQKIIFLFDETEETEISYLRQQTYYTPAFSDSFDDKNNYEIEHNQQLVMIK